MRWPRSGCRPSTPTSSWSPRDALGACWPNSSAAPCSPRSSSAPASPPHSSPSDPGLQLLENAAATAAGLFTIILIFGPISGAHFNPVVSLVDAAFGGRALARRPRLHPGADRGLHHRRGLGQRDVRAAAISISDNPSRKPRSPVREVIATCGLLLVIFSLARSGRLSTAPAAVGAYIGAAYWFTSSTSFANPAISVGRIFSDTFAGIAPASVPAFMLAQLVGGALAYTLIRTFFIQTSPSRTPPTSSFRTSRASSAATTASATSVHSSAGVADDGGVDRGQERAGGAGRGGHASGHARDRAVGRGAVQIGDGGGARERRHAVAHAQQDEPDQRRPRSSRTPRRRPRPAAIRAKTFAAARACRRREQDAAGDLRDADQARRRRPRRPASDRARAGTGSRTPSSRSWPAPRARTRPTAARTATSAAPLPPAPRRGRLAGRRRPPGAGRAACSGTVIDGEDRRPGRAARRASRRRRSAPARAAGR